MMRISFSAYLRARWRSQDGAEYVEAALVQWTETATCERTIAVRSAYLSEVQTPFANAAEAIKPTSQHNTADRVNEALGKLWRVLSIHTHDPLSDMEAHHITVALW